MEPQRIALVTGANQGIGFALVEGLAARLTPMTWSFSPAATPAGSPTPPSGSTEPPRSKGASSTSPTPRPSRISRQILRAQYGGVDIVISNAIGPLTPDRPQVEQADHFIAVANGGTQSVLVPSAPYSAPAAG